MTVTNPPSEQSCQTPRVSVIVIAKMGDEPLFLANLDKQRYEKPFEIIVVEGGNRGKARSVGIAESRAPLIVFIDADCDAPDDWLSKLSILPNLFCDTSIIVIRRFP